MRPANFKKKKNSASLKRFNHDAIPIFPFNQKCFLYSHRFCKNVENFPSLTSIHPYLLTPCPAFFSPFIQSSSMSSSSTLTRPSSFITSLFLSLKKFPAGIFHKQNLNEEFTTKAAEKLIQHLTKAKTLIKIF